jgi:chemotaxis protein CheC
MNFTEIQLDALRELANIGSGNAATSLSSMLGRPVDVSVPKVQVLSLADAVSAVGPPEDIVSAVLLGVVGEIEGNVLLIFGESDRTMIAEMLGAAGDPEFELSALSEVGNIVGSAYLGALGTMTGLELEPSPPQSACDMLSAIVSTVLGSVAADMSTTLYLDSAILIENTPCTFAFLLVPTHEGVAEILTRLGVSE